MHKSLERLTDIIICFFIIAGIAVTFYGFEMRMVKTLSIERIDTHINNNINNKAIKCQKN